MYEMRLKCDKCNKPIIVNYHYGKFDGYLNYTINDYFCSDCEQKIQKIVNIIKYKEKKLEQFLKNIDGFEFSNKNCLYYTNLYLNFRFYMNYRNLQWFQEGPNKILKYRTKQGIIKLMFNKEGKLLNTNTVFKNVGHYFKPIFK